MEIARTVMQLVTMLAVLALVAVEVVLGVQTRRLVTQLLHRVTVLEHDLDQLYGGSDGEPQTQPQDVQAPTGEGDR